MAIIDENMITKMLKSDIKENKFMFYGEDDYLKDFLCNKLCEKVVDKTLRFFNFHQYEDNNSSLEDIFADSNNLPVMSEKTCLLVKNYPLDTLKTDEIAFFENSLKDMPSSTVIIFFFSSATLTPPLSAKWNNIINIFNKLGTVVKIEHRTAEKTAKLIVSKATEKNTSIDFDTALYLVDCVGTDLRTLMNEFNKVAAFSCGNQITKEMIDTTATKCVEAKVFDISESIFSGNTDKAYKIANELIRQKVSAVSIIGAMSSSYVNLYRLKVAINADKTIEDFKKDFQYGDNNTPFSKVMAFARASTLSSIRNAINILSDADIKAKSSRISDEILLTELISKLASCKE